MRYRNRTIRSVADLLKALKVQAKPKQLIWFRGHGKQDWKLVPTLARKPKHLAAENALIKRFKQNAAPHLITLPREEWEWMFLMQHHYAYTRLLDWTESPLTALYFAVDDQKYKKSDGAVWCLDPIALNREASLNYSFDSEIPAFEQDKSLESYLPSRVHASTADLNPVAIMGPRNTPRMAAQLGTFTVNHKVHLPIEKIGGGDHVWKWIIPHNAKATLREELAHLAYRPLTVFPELDRVADLTKELLR